jgi:hypothetical protein
MIRQKYPHRKECIIIEAGKCGWELTEGGYYYLEDLKLIFFAAHKIIKVKIFQNLFDINFFNKGCLLRNKIFGADQGDKTKNPTPYGAGLFILINCII